MHKRFHFNRVLMRYLLSFLIVFLVPTLIFQCTVYPRFASMLNSNVLNTQVQQMSIIQENLRSRFSSLYEYSDALYSSSNIMRYVIAEDTPINRLKIIQELHASYMLNDYHRVFYYNTYTNRIYTSTHSYRPEWLNRTAKDLLYIPALSDDALYSLLSNAKRLSLYSSDEIYLSGIRHHDTLLFLPVVGGYGTLLFMIDTDRLLQMDEDSTTARLLLSADGSVLAASSHIPSTAFSAQDAMQVLTQMQEQESLLLMLNGIEYAVTANKLPEFSMVLLSFTPQEQLFSTLHSIQRWYYGLLALISLLGLSCVVLFTQLHYRPLNKVRQRISTLYPDENVAALSDRLNDWEVIMNALNSVDNQYARINQRLQTIESSSRQYFLFRYIYDGIRTEQDILDMATLYELDVRDRVICIALSIPDVAHNSDLSHALLLAFQSIPERNPNAASCYIIGGVGLATFFMLLFFDNEEELKPYYYQLYQMPDNVKAGIGTMQRLTSVGKSRSLSIAALEVAVMSDTLHIAAQDDVSIQEYNATRKLYDHLQNLELAALRSSICDLEQNYQKLLSLCFDESSHYYVTANAYMNIYNTLVRCFNTLRRNRTLSCSSMEYIYSQYSVPHTIPEMKQTLDDLYVQVLDILRTTTDSRLETGHNDRVKEVFSYFDAHYIDPTLTLTSVSEYFGYSYSNFSHWFRSHTGITFSSYLDKLRIEHSKKLLCSTQMTIEQIATAIGYTNAGTFTRIFKKHENIAPGCFRKNVSED